jgi:hypothetical protein
MEAEGAQRDPEQVARLQVEDVAEIHLGPGLDEAAAALDRIHVGARRRVGRVDRADRGAADHVELEARRQARHDPLEERRQHACLVGTARPPSGQHERGTRVGLGQAGSSAPDATMGRR